MEAYIKLIVDDSGCIEKEVIVTGVVPASMPPGKPPAEPGEINIDIYGDNTAVTNFLIFLAHKIDKGVKVFWELGSDTYPLKKGVFMG